MSENIGFDIIGISPGNPVDKEELISMLQKTFPYPRDGSTIESKGRAQSEMVYDSLLGNKYMRAQSQSEGFDNMSIINKIEKSIELGIPIQAVTAYGTVKFSDGSQPNHVADLADYAGFEMFLCLHEAVKKQYTPGIKARRILDDRIGLWLFGDNEQIQQTQDNYYTELVKMKDAIAIEKGYSQDEFPVEIVLESEIQKDLGFHTYADFEKICNEAVEVLTPYWYDSKKIFASGGSKDDIVYLDSYKQLCAFGWTGEISKEMRDFYQGTLNKNASHVFQDGEVDEYLIRHFASTLAKSKINEKLHGMEYPNLALNMPFGPTAKGVPKEFITSINVRALYYHDKIHGKSVTAPPWRQVGGIETRPGTGKPSRVTTISIGEYTNYASEKISIVLGKTGYSISALLLSPITSD